MKRVQCAKLRRQRKGFLLLGVIVLIAVATMILASVANFSFNHAHSTIQAQQECQLRWTAASSQRLLLHLLKEEPDRILQGIEQNGVGTPLSLSLGDVSLQILVGDESAKLDLNLVHAERKNETASIVKRFCEQGVAVELQPKVRNRDAKDNAFVSWGQVFAPTNYGATPIDLVVQTKQITCWGKRVNINSAADEVLGETCSLVVGDIIANRIVRLRNEEASRSVGQILSLLEITAEQRQKLQRVLTDQSVSQTIWINASHNKGSFESYWLTVREGFPTSSNRRTSIWRIQTFSW